MSKSSKSSSVTTKSKKSPNLGAIIEEKEDAEKHWGKTKKMMVQCVCRGVMNSALESWVRLS